MKVIKKARKPVTLTYDKKSKSFKTTLAKDVMSELNWGSGAMLDQAVVEENGAKCLLIRKINY